MTKKELIKEIATKTGETQATVNLIVNELTNSIMSNVAAGEEVSFLGFGTFNSKIRAERKGVNPLTKEEITIAKATVPTFKFGKKFKELVKENNEK